MKLERFEELKSQMAECFTSPHDKEKILALEPGMYGFNFDSNPECPVAQSGIDWEHGDEAEVVSAVNVWDIDPEVQKVSKVDIEGYVEVL